MSLLGLMLPSRCLTKLWLQLALIRGFLNRDRSCIFSGWHPITVVVGGRLSQHRQQALRPRSARAVRRRRPRPVPRRLLELGFDFASSLFVWRLLRCGYPSCVVSCLLVGLNLNA